VTQIGKLLIGFGIAIVLIGILLSFSDRIPWLGKLPGDVVIKKENFSFYFPITTCLVISLVISLIVFLIDKLK
jgi:hypothetical protein